RRRRRRGQQHPVRLGRRPAVRFRRALPAVPHREPRRHRQLEQAADRRRQQRAVRRRGRLRQPPRQRLLRGRLLRLPGRLAGERDRETARHPDPGSESVMSAYEMNFDGLVGPTHNYGGLSYGNVASQSNSQAVSNPREAARQGQGKMKALMDMGFKQGVFAPQERQDVAALRSLGFSGSDAEVIAKAAREAMPLLAAVSSASSMWTANSCTVSPSADTADGRVHFTAANLNCKFHRSIEHPTTSRVLRAMFGDERHFAHHAALPAVSQFGDEGAANHTRFCKSYGDAGVEFFVFGRSAFDTRYPAPARYPARQTLEASQAVARLHGLSEEGVVYAQQNPAVIDQGVFHNDVIAVGNGEVLFYHQDAFLDTDRVLAELGDKLARRGGNFQAVCVPGSAVSVQDAVRSYLFNSQLLT